MKKWIAALVMLVVMVLPACGVGEETLEAWAHEAGWTPFPLAVQQEELDTVWEEAAKGFGDMTGMVMDGPMLKDMMLQGYAYEPQMDFMNTYLCLTVPQEEKNAAGNYLTFNLFNAKDHYRTVFDINEGEGVEIPCSMIQADTGTEVLRTEVMNLFSAPAMMIN